LSDGNLFIQNNTLCAQTVESAGAIQWKKVSRETKQEQNPAKASIFTSWIRLSPAALRSFGGRLARQ
jgi:hypothetical protein